MVFVMFERIVIVASFSLPNGKKERLLNIGFARRHSSILEEVGGKGSDGFESKGNGHGVGFPCEGIVSLLIIIYSKIDSDK